MLFRSVCVGNCAETEVAGGRPVPHGPGADGERNEQDKRDQDSGDNLSRRAAAKFENQDPCDDEERKEERSGPNEGRERQQRERQDKITRFPIFKRADEEIYEAHEKRLREAVAQDEEGEIDSREIGRASCRERV